MIHVTKRNENDALEFLETRPKEKPFCLTLAFFATHAVDHHPDQFRPQPQSMSLYKDDTVPVPVTATQEAWEDSARFLQRKKRRPQPLALALRHPRESSSA